MMNRNLVHLVNRVIAFLICNSPVRPRTQGRDRKTVFDIRHFAQATFPATLPVAEDKRQSEITRTHRTFSCSKVRSAHGDPQ